MKITSTILGALGILSSFTIAGSIAIENTPVASADGFAQARRPISNPTLFDLALPSSLIHPIFIYHNLPENVNSTLGSLPVGGDVQVYALQFEIAVNERLSIVATKDGYVDFNPDATLADESGFANLGAGLKYAFMLDPDSRTAMSGTMTFEMPTGNSAAFQGEGDGAVNLILNGLKLVDDWQFSGSLGFQIPFSSEQSTLSFLSAHASYEVCSWFIPLVEMNWFHVMDAGDGTGNFPDHVNGLVPAVVEFEGSDFFNIGAVNAGTNRDYVTTAFGFRSRLNEAVNVGFAYEIPLTEEEDSVTEDRFTLDLVWKF